MVSRYSRLSVLFFQVGAEVARRGKGLGMNVYVHDPYAPEEKARTMGVKTVDFEQALALGDFFSLHMPLTPTTKHMFNTQTFSKMKKVLQERGSASSTVLEGCCNVPTVERHGTKVANIAMVRIMRYPLII